MGTKAASLSDETLISLFFERDEDALPKVEAKYGKYLSKIAGNFFPDPRDAQECVSDAYLAAWQAIPPLRPRSLGGYLSLAVRNAAIDRLRIAGRKKRVRSEYLSSLEELAEVLSDGTTAEDELTESELSELIAKYVAGLDERRRYIFVARFHIGDKVAAIAKSLGVSPATVYNEITATKNELKEFLTKRGYTV